MRNRINSLSDIFPKGTLYFYGYPSGQESGFLNLVSPEVEETVAARASVVAGKHVKTLVFDTSTISVKDKALAKLTSLKAIKNSLVVLPPEINRALTGKARNGAIKSYIKSHIKDGALVMAQPFSDGDIRAKFQINPELTIWLNDKKNLRNYIPERFLPKTYGVFASGKELTEKSKALKAPAVIKVSSSSAGDGVYLCRTKAKLDKTIKALGNIEADIIVEQLIDYRQNYGIQFGIPHDSKRPIEIIGISKQITTSEGEFLGGLIDSLEIPHELLRVTDAMLKEILPFARKLGWYGIGCFDVLVDKYGDPYFIDCNFRMTGMSAFLLTHKALFNSKLLSFSGQFTGTEDEFRALLGKYTNKKSGAYLNIVSVTKNENQWRLNAGIVFNETDKAMKCAANLLHDGIRADSLKIVYNKGI